LCRRGVAVDIAGLYTIFTMYRGQHLASLSIK
jgi:hypothetical protein